MDPVQLTDSSSSLTLICDNLLFFFSRLYMSILFVRGFNTAVSGTYNNFDNFFELSNNYKLSYFEYAPREDLGTVYSNLCKKINDGSYTVLMGHSMGGGLLLKFLTEHRTSIPHFNKIIFLMPYISTSISHNLLFSIPFTHKLYLPFNLVAPNRSLTNEGNYLNDDYRLTPLLQPSTMHHDYIPHMDLSILNQDNCVLIYAENESITPIPEKVLDKIHNKIILRGKHEMFRDKDDSKHFFSTIKNILQN